MPRPHDEVGARTGPYGNEFVPPPPWTEDEKFRLVTWCVAVVGLFLAAALGIATDYFAAAAGSRHGPSPLTLGILVGVAVVAGYWTICVLIWAVRAKSASASEGERHR